MAETDKREKSPADKKSEPLGTAQALNLGESFQALAERVVDHLREAIMAGDIAPGTRLVEDKLARQYGISRNPVREALRTLKLEGLVEILPRKGAMVRSISPDSAAELVEIRALLEGYNARLAARRRGGAVVDDLSRVLSQGQYAAISGKKEDLYRLNQDFHVLLASAGNNVILEDLILQLRNRTKIAFPTARLENAMDLWKEHEDILKAVISGDEELASLLASRHVSRLVSTRKRST